MSLSANGGVKVAVPVHRRRPPRQSPTVTASSRATTTLLPFSGSFRTAEPAIGQRSDKAGVVRPTDCLPSRRAATSTHGLVSGHGKDGTGGQGCA